MSNLKATRRRRHFDICQALNMTNLSIELNRLEELGVPHNVIRRWRNRSRFLLDEILERSAELGDPK